MSFVIQIWGKMLNEGGDALVQNKVSYAASRSAKEETVYNLSSFKSP